MCSFTFLRSPTPPDRGAIEAANRLARFRGPDFTNIVQEVGADGWAISMVHNLLDISGTACAQPRVQGERGSRTWVLFNGEIYNFRDLCRVDCDSDCVLPTFAEHGWMSGRMLDGEYSIVVYEEATRTLTVLVDPFLTKPLYFGRGANSPAFGVATCASTLYGLGLGGVTMAEPNTAYRVRFRGASAEVEKRHPIFDFEPRQHKRSFDGWCEAFVAAVGRRAGHGAHLPSVFLSSGYDSGGICLALNGLSIPYETFSLRSGEQLEILGARIRLNTAAGCRKAHLFDGLPSREAERISADIQENVELFTYQHEDAPGKVTSLQRDGGAIGACFIAKRAREAMRLVNLSGSGADEILSDYGHAGRKIFAHSEFGGLFPEDLGSIFPWRKFYGDTQRSYLFKDEYVLGRYGIEGRYPYLDRRCVQEFLWLAADLKNLEYKAPLAHFLRTGGYPFEAGAKRGFNPHARPSVLQRAVRRLRRAFGGRDT